MKRIWHLLFIQAIVIGLWGCQGESEHVVPKTPPKPVVPMVEQAQYDSIADLLNRYKIWYEIMIDSMGKKDEIIKRQEERLALNAELIRGKVAEGDYTFGVPPAPPFRALGYDMGDVVWEDCSRGEPFTGYVIELAEDNYSALIQDTYGVRKTYYMESDHAQNDYDRIFVPGMKLRISAQYCGSGGFGQIMSVKTMRR